MAGLDLSQVTVNLAPLAGLVTAIVTGLAGIVVVRKIIKLVNRS